MHGSGIEGGSLSSQEPKFPASVFLGVSFGLAFRGGGEGLLGVRQRGEVGVLCGAKPLHQGLELVFLLLEIQLNTAGNKENGRQLKH